MTMPTLTVAVSGSGGLIGSALCERLLRSGHRVVRLTRPGSGGRSGHRDASCLAWDPQQGIVDPERLNSIDAIVHLAGESVASGRWNRAQKRAIRDSRVLPTRKLVEQMCAAPAGPRVLISASAIGYYGDCGAGIVDESTPAADSFLAQVARDWELECAPLAESGIRVTHPRFGMVLSQQGGALAKILPLFRWMLAGRLGDGRQYWSWIALDDCTRLIEWMLVDHSASGAYNAVAPEPLTNAQFTTTLASVVGRPAKLAVPKFALRLAMGEMADALLLCSCRAVPKRLLQAGFPFQHSSLAEFLEGELSSDRQAGAGKGS